MQKRRMLPAAALAVLACLGGATAMTALATLPATPAMAAKNEVGPKVGKPLKEAQDLAGKKQLKEALAKVKEAQAVEKKSSYEEHSINEFLGWISANLGDYRTAAAAFDATTKSGFMPADQLPGRVKTVAQLYYQAKDYGAAVVTAERYRKEFGNDAELQVMVAQIHYLQKDYARTAAAIDPLIKAAIKQGRKPEEGWLQLAMSAAYNQKDMAGVAAHLRDLVRYYPSDDYWRQLVDVSLSGLNLSDRLNLEYYRLRYRTGLIDRGDELMEMAQLAIQAGLPGEARTILDDGFARGLLGGVNKERETRLLNMAKNQAEELLRELPEVEREAEAAKAGDADVNIGEAYASYGQNDKAIALISRGIAKGGLKNAEDAALRLALANHAAGNKDAAKAALKGIKPGTPIGTIADLWALYIDTGM